MGWYRPTQQFKNSLRLGLVTVRTNYARLFIRVGYDPQSWSLTASEVERLLVVVVLAVMPLVPAV